MGREIKLISAKKARANVTNYYDAEVLQEEFSNYYQSDLVSIINNAIEEASSKGRTETSVTLRLPDKFCCAIFNPINWLQEKIEQAGYRVISSLESSCIAKFSIDWKEEFKF